MLQQRILNAKRKIMESCIRKRLALHFTNEKSFVICSLLYTYICFLCFILFYYTKTTFPINFSFLCCAYMNKSVINLICIKQHMVEVKERKKSNNTTREKKNNSITLIQFLFNFLLLELYMCILCR